jgi:hypothetical protein
MLIYSMSVSVDGFIADRERSSRRRERAVSERLLLRCAIRSRPGYSSRPALAGIVGGRREWTALITSVLSIPCK